MLRSLLVFTSFTLPVFALAQDPAQTPKTDGAAAEAQSAEDVFNDVQDKMRNVKSREEAEKVVKDALESNKEVFAKGDGPFFAGKLHLMTGNAADAAKLFKSFVDANPESERATDARAFAAYAAVNGDDLDGAQALLDKIDEAKLSEETKQMFEMTKSNLQAERARAGMNGNVAPDFTATDIVNGPADFTLSKQKGKVVVVDFFATWCPPCRMVVPEMVELQKKHANDGLQVVGVTRFYGSGMDFSDPAAEKPHGGKRVGGRGKDALSHEDEIKVNNVFVKAFEMNYPIVFTADEVGKAYGVQGIPTVFVIGKDGNVIGSVVGSGEENHAKIVAMVEKALGGGERGKAKSGK